MKSASIDGYGAVVVGGTSGMGRAVVHGLVAEGANVVVLDLAVPAELPDGVAFIQTDVADHAAVVRSYAEIDETLGNLDIVVNTVGVSGPDQPAEELSEEAWDRILAANLSGVFWSCQEAAKRMLPRSRGSIVNFASLAGILVARGYRTVHYHAAKAGVIGMSKAMAAEWGERGVRINTVAPGLFQTAAPSHVWRGDATKMAEHTERVISLMPMRRAGDPREVVPLVLFLASDASSYITGESIIIDGGRALTTY